MNETIKNILERRSIRNFSDRDVKWDDLELIIRCGRAAPNSWDNQTFIITVVSNKKIIRGLAEITWKYLGGKLEDHLFFGSSLIIIVSDRRDNFVRLADAGCVLENMFIAAQSLGISSVWVNQFSTLTEKLDVIELFEALKIPRDYAVCGIGVFGYAGAPPRNRELKSELVYFTELAI
jgi:nitroreductase